MTKDNLVLKQKFGHDHENTSQTNYIHLFPDHYVSPSNDGRHIVLV
jgi:hypothetical protein